MQKEKRLINSFVLANMSDAIVTGVGLSLPGFMEKGLRAQEMFAQGRFSEMLIAKVAITAFMIGIFALAAQRRTRWYGPIHTALRLGNVIVWAVVAWNELNVGLGLAAMLHTG